MNIEKAGPASRIKQMEIRPKNTAAPLSCQRKTTSSQRRLLVAYCAIRPTAVKDFIQVCICTKRTFSARRRPFLSWPRVFPSALGCGGCRGAARIIRRMFGPWPGSVARALGVQDRGELALFAGLLPAEPEPSRPMKTPRLLFLFVLRSAAVYYCSVCYKYHAIPQKLLYAFDPATVQQPPCFKIIPFVTAMNGDSSCV